MPEQTQDRRDRCLKNLARLATVVDPKLLYPLKHRGEESQAHMMTLIRSRQALVSCRTQLVNHVPKEERSQVLRGSLAQVPRKELPQQSGREHIAEALMPALEPILEQRDRLAYPAHPRLRSPVGGDLQGELPRNRAPAPGRGDWTAYGA
jgi:hypothetical protein